MLFYIRWGKRGGFKHSLEHTHSPEEYFVCCIILFGSEYEARFIPRKSHFLSQKWSVKEIPWLLGKLPTVGTFWKDHLMRLKLLAVPKLSRGHKYKMRWTAPKLLEQYVRIDQGNSSLPEREGQASWNDHGSFIFFRWV